VFRVALNSTCMQRCSQIKTTPAPVCITLQINDLRPKLVGVGDDACCVICLCAIEATQTVTELPVTSILFIVSMLSF
jgi:hypothetical protein